MIRVAVADDQALVRSGFSVLLRSADDIEVVGEAGDGREAVDLVAAECPDVILMDIRMPEMDGIEATRRIAASGCDTRVLVLTTFDLDEYVLGALRAGASGFLLKDTLPDDLLGAVRVVAAGEALLAPKRHPPPDRAVRGRRGAGGTDCATAGVRHPDRARGRGARRGRARPVERRDRRRALHGARDREDAREPAAHQARLP